MSVRKCAQVVLGVELTGLTWLFNVGTTYEQDIICAFMESASFRGIQQST